jgi:hypothetical protein
MKLTPHWAIKHLIDETLLILNSFSERLVNHILERLILLPKILLSKLFWVGRKKVYICL